MKKKGLWLGMLVMVLVFGMMVIGCDNGGGDTNILNTMGLSKAAPNATALAIGNINMEQFNEVRDLLDGFQGWSTFDGDLNLIWTGKTQSQVDFAITTLEGFSWIGSKDWDSLFYPSRVSGDGFYIPAGTLWIYFIN